MNNNLPSPTFYQKTKNCIDYLFQVVRDVLHVFLSCWLCFAMLGFGYYALHVNDQGRDVLASLDPKDIVSFLLLLVSLLFWAYEIWFSARFALLMTDFTSSKSEKRIEWLENAVLVIASIVPIGLFLWACYRFNKDLTNGWLFIVTLLLYCIALFYRDRYIHFVNRVSRSSTVIKKISIGREAEQVSESPKLNSRKVEFGEFSAAEKITFWLPLALLLIFSFFVWKFPVKFPQYLSPLVVIFLSMGVWTGMITYLIRLERQYRIPAFFLVVVINVAFSFFNNNHTVRIVESDIAKEDRRTISNHFLQWLTTNQSGDSTKKIKKVVLVAGQGGGIRAAYWTGSVLAQLQDTIPDFEKHIYAISSVSGSSLGAAAYNASLYDTYNKPEAHAAKILSKIQGFLSKDYLSPVTAAFVFPDMLQRFWFLPIESFDRAKYLEYSWEEGWNESNGSSTFRNGFSNLWKGKTEFAMPSLFLNGTHTETGRKVITSNVNCSDTSLQSRDIIGIIGKDVPLSTAALLSARFPGVTPGALIPDKEGSAWGNVVDGGYYDNSGAVTLLDVYKEIIKGHNPKNDNIRFVALIIQNGTESQQHLPPLRFMYEAQTVPSAFMNAYNVRPEQEIAELKNMMKLNGDTLIEINLKRDENENLPLGWFLSAKAQELLNTQLSDFKRSNNMKWLIEFLRD